MGKIVISTNVSLDGVVQDPDGKQGYQRGGWFTEAGATILRGDLVDEITRLRHKHSGDIVVYASYQLGRMLIENDLVDEVRLFVFPVVVGG